ncbi:MAG: protein-export protein SecB [marine bacterium B5-7]|nr:MAG: protein-export protein SecB [marine bacterium B5-7]
MSEQNTNAAEKASGDTASDTPSNPLFELEKIYVKDVSFESPSSPAIFMQKDYKPEINIEIDIEHTELSGEGKYYDIVLSVEVKATMSDQIVFLVSVQQAGVFHISGFDEAQMTLMMQVAAPNTLLPFAREAVADLVTHGGFPQLLIQPVNFESLLRNKLKRAQEEAEASTTLQ